MKYLKEDGKLYRHSIVGGQLQIIGPEDNIELVIESNPAGPTMPWSIADMGKYGEEEANVRNKYLAEQEIKRLLDGVDVGYRNLSSGTLKLSDDVVIESANVAGNRSLLNTATLIESAVKTAVISLEKEIVITDADDKDVKYTIDKEDIYPERILPVKEIYEYLNTLYLCKKEVKNNIKKLLEKDVFDFDEVLMLNGRLMLERLVDTKVK